MATVNCTHCGTENQASSPYCFRCGHELPKLQMGPTPVQAIQPVKSVKKSRRPVTVAAIIGFALSYFAVQQIFFRPPSFDKAMMTVASELNKTCPFMVDKETRLDNAVALPNNIFQYNYTLINIDKSQIDEATVKNAMTPGLINNVKTNPELRIYREHKTTLAYNYRDKNGSFILKISVTPDLYQ
jgi:zinc-ribbon domain